MSGLASFFSSFLGHNDKENALDYNESITSHQHNNTQEEPPRQPVDPRKQSSAQWRANKNDELRKYMEKRMILNDDNDEDSQQQEQDGVPHVDDTTDKCHLVSHLNLSTNTFSLSLGLVKQAWHLRHVPRREYITSNHYENDGPLATLFKKVLCLQVTQLSTNDSQVSNLAHRAFQTKKQTDIYMYFYNKYAQHISDFLERHDADRVLISLQHIPAKCILPTGEEYSWNNRETLSPYCLCIGDKSSMKLDQDGVLVKVPFDAPDVKVTLARVYKDKVAQVDMTHDSVRSHATVEYLQEETLETAYQEWGTKQQEEKAEEQQQEEGVPVEERDGADAGTARRAETDTANNGPAKKKAKTTTKYHSLNELRDIYNARKAGEHPVVNVMCAVIGFSTPTMTRGFDYQVNVTLVDESVPLPAAGDDIVAATGLSIFCKEKDALPRIVKAGDVLTCHRVAIQEWNDDIQLLGRRTSSYVVVRPLNVNETTIDCEWDVVPTSRGGSDFPQSDREDAAVLWQWAQLRLARYPTIHKQSAKLTLSDLAPPEQPQGTQEKTGDLTVMVSAIIFVPETLRSTSTPLCFLRVWDGTGSASSDPLPTPAAGAGDAIREGDPPSQALQAIATAVERIKAVDDAGDASTLEPPKCLCGRVMNVAVWEEPDLHLVKDTLSVGTFIRLRNVHETRLLTGLRCLGISSKSYLTPLPNNTYEVRELLENHQRRVRAKDPFNPESGVLPLGGEAAAAPQEDEMEVDETPAEDAAENGVASIAQCISKDAPSSFEVQFHITGLIPAPEEGRHPLQCLCRGDMFQFAVSVNDETAAIDALVADAVGKDLFQMEATAATALSMSDAVTAIKDVTRHDKLWKGEIRSFELNGSRFFILDSIEDV